MDLAQKLRFFSADQHLGYRTKLGFYMANDRVLTVDSVDNRHRPDQSIWYFSNTAQQ